EVLFELGRSPGLAHHPSIPGRMQPADRRAGEGATAGAVPDTAPFSVKARCPRFVRRPPAAEDSLERSGGGTGGLEPPSAESGEPAVLPRFPRRVAPLPAAPDAGQELPSAEFLPSGAGGAVDGRFRPPGMGGAPDRSVPFPSGKDADV